MKNLFVPCLSLFVIASCKTDLPVAKANTTFPASAGNWKLINAWGGFRGGPFPIDSTKDNFNFKLSGYYTSGGQFFFLNEGTYEIIVDTSVAYPRLEIQFDANPFASRYFLNLKNDSLSLFFDGGDGDNFLLVKQ